MTTRSIRVATCVAAAGLTLAAPGASATEGPPTGGTPLPDTLRPVALPPVGAPAPKRLRPRVQQARLTPRRVRSGRASRLRVALATPGRLRIVVERRARGRSARVWTRTLTTRGGRMAVRLPARLRAGRYRVTVVAIDTEGTRSRAVHRSLLVITSSA